MIAILTAFLQLRVINYPHVEWNILPDMCPRHISKLLSTTYAIIFLHLNQRLVGNVYCKFVLSQNSHLLFDHIFVKSIAATHQSQFQGHWFISINDLLVTYVRVCTFTILLKSSVWPYFVKSITTPQTQFQGYWLTVSERLQKRIQKCMLLACSISIYNWRTLYKEQL